MDSLHDSALGFGTPPPYLGVIFLCGSVLGWMGVGRCQQSLERVVPCLLWGSVFAASLQPPADSDTLPSSFLIQWLLVQAVRGFSPSAFALDQVLELIWDWTLLHCPILTFCPIASPRAPSCWILSCGATFYSIPMALIWVLCLPRSLSIS